MAHNMIAQNRVGTGRSLKLAFSLLALGMLSACAASSGSGPKPMNVSTTARPAAAQAAPTQITPLGQRILVRVNEARGSTLSLSADLQKAAAGHAADMAARNFFSHINPEGQSPRERILAIDPNFKSKISENIATATFLPGTTMRDKADKFAHDWMNSPTHRRNIRNQRYTKTGLGVAQRGNETYVVQLFSE